MLRPTLLALFAGAATLPAQQVSPKVDSLVARTFRGDNQARNQLGTIARGMITDVVTRRVDGPTARTAAQVTLAMAAPLSAPDSSVTAREIDWRGGAVRALRAALAADPGDLWSMGWLERLAPYPHIWTKVSDELAAFRALVAAHPGISGPFAATRIRLEIEAGAIDSAAAAFAALPDTGLSPAQRSCLEAEVRFAEGRNAAGRDAYFAGARAIADSADAACYLESLRTIIKPGEQREWAALGFAPGTHAAWLETFWAKRDLEDARPLGTRLPEQFRRWRVALSEYRFDEEGSLAEALPVPKGAAPIEGTFSDIMFPDDTTVSELAYANRFTPLSRVLDDRGLLVLRHGEPIHTVAGPGVSSMMGENLVWAGPQGPFIIGFSRAGSFDGDLRWGMLARNAPVGDIMSVCQVDARLCVVAGMDQLGKNNPWGAPPSNIARLNASNRIRMDSTETRARAEAMDGNPETFTHSLDAVLQAFGIPGGGTLVVIGIPVDGLVPDAAALAAARSFSAHVAVVVGDTVQGRVIASLDTVRRWTSATAVGKGAFLNAYFTVPAPVGTWSVSVVVGDTGHLAGTGKRFRGVPVVPFDGRALDISDPILGRTGGGLSWHHGTDVIPLNPTNAWHTGEAVLLAYDLDGLVAGHNYQTRYELWKADGRPKNPSISVSSEAVATATRESVRRELSLKSQGPGDYLLLVRVRDAVTGQERIRQRRIAVRK